MKFRWLILFFHVALRSFAAPGEGWHKFGGGGAGGSGRSAVKLKGFFLFLVVCLSAFAVPFELELVSEEVRGPKPSDTTYRGSTRVYRVKGTPLRLRVVVNGSRHLDIYEATVFHEDRPREVVADSSSYVFLKPNGKIESVTLRHYKKAGKIREDDPIYRGVGELVIQPVLSLPDIPMVQAVLSYRNYTQLDAALKAKGVTMSEGEANQVVMDATHLGRVLKQYGFVVDPAFTAHDNQLQEINFRFLTPALNRTFWQRCRDLFPRMRRRGESAVNAGG